MRWRIQARQGLSLDTIPDGAERAQILTDNFHAPNPDDSFRSFSEQVVEDIIVGGYGAIEVQASNDANQPLLFMASGRVVHSDEFGLGWIAAGTALFAGYRSIGAKEPDQAR